jgi:hypothetical protein
MNRELCVPGLDHLMTQMLRTDACIIAEDDENVVVALRVPKSTLRAYLPFLAALADHTSPLGA